MSTSAPGVRPVAAYTDRDDVDVTAGAALLRDNGFDVRYLDTQDPAAIRKGAADAAALLVGYAHIDADLIGSLPNLRIIALMSMGYNNIDLDAARRRGIWVTNIPGAATEEVAAHTLALTLALTRDLAFYLDAARNGRWNSRNEAPPVRLSCKRLGLIGLGRIGQRFGALARHTFADVVGYDPLLAETPEAAAALRSAGIRRTGFDEVLETSDVVSLHVPLTEATDKLINQASLRRMRPGSYLVNVSRGQLLDVPAVVDALDSARLAGVAVDVLEEEPPPAAHPLLTHPRALVTPHVAYLSDVTEAEYVRQQAQNVLSWRRDGAPDAPLFPLERVQA
ncbi:MAG: D-3-phosphoglycerate dehydrogenase [uncultured Arthrobacter sp.]|uniref:D-3-phosphoglycerate dehydrogenase n=1 Tax=uncultured Arthrobacter sp. TaxID=114050 RepID=A0A6J4H9N1_9MICC|nr:C-terminal binding protein [uncultured Arthrobacter sp.]CAA9217105.1 MAG: D-3-phosphoglycerate dehydrogenase [uncultured Arthrobacter sp.]